MTTRKTGADARTVNYTVRMSLAERQRLRDLAAQTNRSGGEVLRLLLARAQSSARPDILLAPEESAEDNMAAEAE